MPIRIQRKRTKGWKMPENAVYVGRPSKWGNPFKIGGYYGREGSIEMFKTYLQNALIFDPSFLDELEGKDLACWCSLNKPCHADILLKFMEASPRGGK